MYIHIKEKNDNTLRTLADLVAYSIYNAEVDLMMDIQALAQSICVLALMAL